MVTNIVRPFRAETIPEFITRHGGVASTANIAGRFGWYLRDAKRKLDALARDGEIEKIGPHSTKKTGDGTPYAGICSWRLPT